MYCTVYYTGEDDDDYCYQLCDSVKEAQGIDPSFYETLQGRAPVRG
jgi:hypothetical protein